MQRVRVSLKSERGSVREKNKTVRRKKSKEIGKNKYQDSSQNSCDSNHLLAEACTPNLLSRVSAFFTEIDSSLNLF